MPLVGVGPGPVEYILSVGVRLDEQRHRRRKARAALQQQELRLPAGSRAGAAAFNQGRKEFVADERIAARERVPFRGADAGERIGNAQALRRHFAGTRRGHAGIIELRVQS